MTKAKTVKEVRAKIIGDPNEQVEILPDLLDKVIEILYESLEGYEKGKWKEAMEIQYLRKQGYRRPQIEVIWRVGYCEYYKIPYSGRTKDKRYNSFNSHLERVVIVGCLGEEEFNQYLESGKSVTAVWAEVSGKRKNESKKQKPETLKQLQQERAEGVENVAELLEGMEKLKKAESKEREEEPTSWTAPQEDENHKWIMKCREIVRGEPIQFIRMIDSLVRSDLLSNDTLESVKTDLKIL